MNFENVWKIGMIMDGERNIGYEYQIDVSGSLKIFNKYLILRRLMPAKYGYNFLPNGRKIVFSFWRHFLKNFIPIFFI